MKLSQAKEIADKWLDYLAPACTRIEIAGSVRREKPEVKDIELVAVPLIHQEEDLFGGPGEKVNILETLIGGLKRGKGFRSIVKDGPRYKQIVLNEGINLDLFIVLPPAEWGVLFLIRTGPADFSKKLVTSRRAGGLLPSNLKVKDGAVWRGIDKLPTPEERDVFRLLDMAYTEPRERGIAR